MLLHSHGRLLQPPHPVCTGSSVCRPATAGARSSSSCSRQQPAPRRATTTRRAATSSGSDNPTTSVSVADNPQQQQQQQQPSAGAAGGGAKNAELAARIAAAKAYKQSAGGAASPPAPPPSNTSAADTAAAASEADVPQQLTAEQQEAMRQQYLQQLQQQQQELAAQNSAYNSFLQTSSSSSSSSGGAEAALEKLAQEDPGWGPGSKTGPARPDFYTSADAPAVQELYTSAPRRSGTGSASEPADWLKGVLADTGKSQVNPNMRAEDFTAAKEAAAKQRGAEIITAFPEDFAPSSSTSSPSSSGGDAGGAGDASSSAAAAADGETDEDGKYRPKVTTWGVFPRPQNISSAYGGGRNIRPGQELETPEQKAQREADYAAALAKYKKSVFTDSLSDEELAAAQSRFNEGMKLFNRGVIDQALVVFDEVREKVPLKSKLGGMSTLQAAVCYDTLGNGRQAEALYKRIQGHPTREVGRKARQLVFGFQAMTFLKTEGLNYSVKKEDYLKYFRRAADRQRVYIATEEERVADAAEARKAAAIAAGIVLGPVIMMGAMVLGK